MRDHARAHDLITEGMKDLKDPLFYYIWATLLSYVTLKKLVWDPAVNDGPVTLTLSNDNIQYEIALRGVPDIPLDEFREGISIYIKEGLETQFGCKINTSHTDDVQHRVIGSTENGQGVFMSDHRKGHGKYYGTIVFPTTGPRQCYSTCRRQLNRFVKDIEKVYRKKRKQQ